VQYRPSDGSPREAPHDGSYRPKDASARAEFNRAAYNLRAMPIRVAGRSGVVVDVAVEVEALGVAETCIRDIRWFRGPIGRHKPAEAAAVVPGPKHVEAGFGISFFAGTTGPDTSFRPHPAQP
jgi:hypothetical protein